MTKQTLHFIKTLIQRYDFSNRDFVETEEVVDILKTILEIEKGGE